MRPTFHREWSRDPLAGRDLVQIMGPGRQHHWHPQLFTDLETNIRDGPSNFFPILLSLLGSQVHGGHQKAASSSMELQRRFSRSRRSARQGTHDDNSTGGLLMPQPRSSGDASSAVPVYLRTAVISMPFSHIFASMKALTARRDLCRQESSKVLSPRTAPDRRQFEFASISKRLSRFALDS